MPSAHTSHSNRFAPLLAASGGIARNPVFLAPMSGITDVPFRRLAWRLGAGLVVAEMVASEALANGHKESVARIQGGASGPLAIQLAGREARWLAAGARVAEDSGAELIDINMGCPARRVTGGLSGSALMRDLDRAEALIEAVVSATDLPVTLKMRLGWDLDALTAPELARRAEQLGVRWVTVHGRTRQQFFKGRADWRAIRWVKAAVGIPVVANGDIASPDDARDCLAQSGADALMLGRAAYGAPWLPGVVAKALTCSGEMHSAEATAGARWRSDAPDVIAEHYETMLSHYGIERGVKNARKHLGWYLETAGYGGRDLGTWRARLLGDGDPARVLTAIRDAFRAAPTQLS